MNKCLGNEEYMQTKNSLIVLKRLLPFFPHTKECAEKIEKLLDQLTENASISQDLHMMVSRYKDELHKRKQALPTEEAVKSKKNEEEKKKEKEESRKSTSKDTESKLVAKKHNISPHEDYRRAKKKKEEEKSEDHSKSKDESRHSHKK